MANFEINVPDDLHERLRRVAGSDADDSVVSEFALAVIRREVERLEWKERWDELPASAATALEEGQAVEALVTQLLPRPALSWEEWRERLAQRPKTNTVTSAAAALEEARQERECLRSRQLPTLLHIRRQCRLGTVCGSTPPVRLR